MHALLLTVEEQRSGDDVLHMINYELSCIYVLSVLRSLVTVRLSIYLTQYTGECLYPV